MTAPLPISDYMAKVYADPPCWDLVADVFTSHLGLTVQQYLEWKTVSNSPREIAKAFRLVLHKGQHGFSRIEEPADYALVLMGKSAQLGLHHCGVCYGGKVLHATPAGTYYEDVHSLQEVFPLMEFWAR